MISSHLVVLALIHTDECTCLSDVAFTIWRNQRGYRRRRNIKMTRNGQIQNGWEQEVKRDTDGRKEMHKERRKTWKTTKERDLVSHYFSACGF